RSMVKPSEPVVAAMKPEGAEAAPNVAASGLIHKEMGLGVAVESYLPTRKKVSPACRSVVSKVADAPVPLFCVPKTNPEGELDLTNTCSRKLVLSVAHNAPKAEESPFHAPKPR